MNDFLTLVLSLSLALLLNAGHFCAAALLRSSPSPAPVQVSQVSGFDSWRPYKNPNKLISIGINKGEVLAIAGNPDEEDSYYRAVGRRLVRVSDWYYIRQGVNAETTLLKFEEGTLVSITSTPIK